MDENCLYGDRSLFEIKFVSFICVNTTTKSYITEFLVPIVAYVGHVVLYLLGAVLTFPC